MKRHCLLFSKIAFAITLSPAPATCRREDRARDVLDILLVEMLGQLDPARMRSVVERIFAERAAHAFPPSAALLAECRPELENLAQELGYRTQDGEGIEREFAALVQAIATAPD